MTPAARIAAAIELFAAIEAAPRRPADATANEFFRARRFIGSGDRRAVSARVWSLLRTRRRTDWWLEHVGLRATPELMVAAGLMLEGWSIEGVAQSFSGGQHAPAPLPGRQSAALGRLAGHTLDHPDMPDAVRFELPDWILPRLEARFGANLAAEMAALGEPAPMDMRVNLLQGDREDARMALAAEGIEATPTPWSPWGLRVAERRLVTTGPAFQQGLVEIQDEGSQLIALLVGPQPGMAVCDWCAGAGGKTLALAMMMRNRGHITACDVSEHRLEGAVRRLRRAGVHNVERHLVSPGDKWAKRHAGRFDRVLVDAPCTGTGTWRRNPDARARLAETDLLELVPKQAAILDVAQRLVRPGGWLVYATCSILPEENEQQMSAFLARHPRFAPVPRERLAGAVPTLPPGRPADAGSAFISLTPLLHGTDGFFAAVLECATGPAP